MTKLADGKRGNSMWKKILQFDNPNGLGGFVRSPFLNINRKITGEGAMGARGMLLFLGNSIYFILALCGNYEEPIFMADLAAAVVMGLIFLTMVRFTRREGERWRPVYQKIKYFPVDRKKYLLAKAVPAGCVIGMALGIQWMAYLCRILMHRGIPMEIIAVITLGTLISGIFYFLSFLLLLVLGERALNLFPVPFGAGIIMVHLLCRGW